MRVHDELVLEVPDAEFAAVRRALPELTGSVVQLSVAAPGRSGRRPQLGPSALDHDATARGVAGQRGGAGANSIDAQPKGLHHFPPLLDFAEYVGAKLLGGTTNRYQPGRVEP